MFRSLLQQQWLSRGRRLAITIAIMSGFLVLVSMRYRSELKRVRTACLAAVESQKVAIINKRAEQERLRLAKRDAETEAATLRWTQVIRETSHRLAARTLTVPRNISETTRSAEEQDVSDTHWAFRRLRRVAPPKVRNRNWGRNGIDRFILSRIEEKGLQPRPAAEPHVLVRRLWFDVLGLPPTPEEPSPLRAARAEDFDRLVEELLADPAFGERSATPWLDLVRYADSNGYEEDELRPHAYPYRDFVIWALNEDLPFDEFIRWQIAGDELAPDNPLAVAATGFVTAAPYNTFMPQESERFDELDDIVSTMGSAILGLTIGCARCHDHPYDDISTEEYYSLVSIFRATKREHRYLLPDQGKQFRQIADPVDRRRAEVKQILLAREREESIAALDFTEAEKDLLRQPIDPTNQEQIRLLSLCGRCLMIDDSFIDEDTNPLPQDQQRYRRLLKELERLEPRLPPRPPRGLTLAGSEVVETPILREGKLERKGQFVGPRFLSTLTLAKTEWDQGDWKAWDTRREGSRPRTALANWITDVSTGAGALLARVIVNRVWQQHFGRGLVDTPSDFGNNGASPSHPELLEWLACELVDSGWSLKHIHRLILQSSTYRQDSVCTPETLELDPENRLLARWRPQRLSAEMLRDSLLRLGGNLNPGMYGPAFQPAIPREAIFNRDGEDADSTWPTNVVERPAVWRRSIYILKRRTNPVPLLQLFDAPDGIVACDQRRNTTVPTQALALWNDPFIRAQATRVAARAQPKHDPEGPSSRQPAGSITQLFELLLGRPPEQTEVDRATSFLQERGGLPDLAQVILMTNEFMYVH